MTAKVTAETRAAADARNAARRAAYRSGTGEFAGRTTVKRKLELLDDRADDFFYGDVEIRAVRDIKLWDE